jgi:hypothetical protein
MSETKAHSFIAGPAIAAFVSQVSKTIGTKTFSADVSTLPDAALAYLVEYGFNQSIGDTKALSALEKAKQGEKAGVFPKGFSENLETNNAAKAIAAYHAANEGSAAAYEAWENAFLEERAQARLDAIVAGEMVFGSSERLTPEERDRREYTLSLLKSALAQKGKKLPKAAEDLARMTEYVYAQKSHEIEKEVARRAKLRASAGDIDLSAFA